MTGHIINTSVGTAIAVATVPTQNILQTLIIAIIGAVSSFITSLVLKEAMLWVNKMRQK